MPRRREDAGSLRAEAGRAPGSAPAGALTQPGLPLGGASAAGHGPEIWLFNGMLQTTEMCQTEIRT